MRGTLVAHSVGLQAVHKDNFTLNYRYR